MRVTQPISALIAVSLIAACGTPSPSEPISLTLVAHDSFVGGLPPDAFAAFTQETGVEVEILSGGDAGAMVNQAILTRDNPLADVLFGIDDTFLSRGLSNDLFEPYTSPLLGSVPDQLELDDRVTPIDFGDVCVNYDLAAFGNRPPPLNLEQLTNPEFTAELVVENPATSSPGLAFLLATISVFGEDGWQDYWRALVTNDIKVVSDWDTAYYAEFSRYGGDRPLVVSYASSPVAEVIFSDPPLADAPTGIIDEGCYRQIEFAGVLAGTDHPKEAGLLIDYLLSPPFQSTIPLNWFVYPANQDATIPVEFSTFSVVPSAPHAIAPQDIEANRERWIEEWSEIVLP